MLRCRRLDSSHKCPCLRTCSSSTSGWLADLESELEVVLVAGLEAVLEEGLALGPVGSASGPAESVSALAVLAMAPEASEPEALVLEPDRCCMDLRA